MEIRVGPVHFVWLILGIVSFGGLVNSGLHLSNALFYVADALNILLFIFAIRKLPIINRVQGMKMLKVIFWLFLLATIIGIIGNGVSLLLTVWGMRNIYRYILFFISCVVLLSSKNIERFFDVLPKIFWINFIITLMQFTVFGIRGDNLGGIFGIAQGVNGATTIFINIVIAYVVSQYLNKNWTLRHTTLYLFAYFAIAALSETKGNYIFFLIIIMFALIIARKSLRTFSFGIAAIIAIFVGLNILDRYFPGSVDFLVDFDKANDYMNAGYLGTVTFTRNALLEVANQYFFKDNAWLYLFGYGIGAVETSQFFTSPFYESFGYMNYRQYGVAMVVLQNGYIGLGLYFAFFLTTFVVAIKKSRSDDRKFNAYMVMAACVALFSIIDSFYATLFVDIAYWVYFIMAIPFIFLKERVRRL
ncbi:hypothetical protein [Bacillus sp. X1(2014)]|uniref:hypothetical protein n=1 Tax=Bacillus sp. X1(2014) TaxID=1565991 RepID=UPI00119DDB22|nr:hypothetical protein [Bacillus sp. X1(2014)]